MIATEESTYGKLFRDFPPWFVAYLASLFGESPDMVRKVLFNIFVTQHLFICGNCGNEFTAAGTEETDLVCCEKCGR